MGCKKFLFLIFILTGVICRAQTEKECHEMIIEGIKEMNNKNHARSLEILTEAMTLAQENHWAQNEFLALNNIGANYYQMLDYGEALDNYLEAYKVALRDLEARHEMIVLNNIAILYSKEKEYGKAEEYFLKAHEIAGLSGDSLKIGMYSVNLASVFNEQENPTEAKKYIDFAYANLKRETPIFYQAEITYAQYLVLTKEFDEACSILVQLLPKLKTAELSEHRISVYMLLSSIYKEENSETAINYARKALLDKNATLENKVDVYRQLTELYRKLGRNDEAFLYKDSVIWAKDSLNQVKNGKLFENSRIKFELQNSQKKLTESQKRLNAERRLFYTIIGGIIVLILITLWAIRNYYVKLKQRKIIAENSQKIAELELEKEKSDKLILEQKLSQQSALALLEKERFKNEIEAKNRQLASKALSISTRNELIEDIIESLSRESEIRGNENLRKRIFELRNHLKKESEWDDFFTHFEEVNHGFLKSLKEKHSDLTSNDVRYISYVYMNLSTKEISSLLNITVEACRKRKERIIKKMELPEEVDLYSYLSAI